MDHINMDERSGAATVEWLRAFNAQEDRRRQEEALAELARAAEQVRQKIEEEKEE